MRPTSGRTPASLFTERTMALTRDQVTSQVKDLIADSLGVEQDTIQVTSSFIDDLGADSLDIVELVMAIEKDFELDIPDEDAERISTVQDAIDYILDQA